jgi:hypothetical protein
MGWIVSIGGGGEGVIVLVRVRANARVRTIRLQALTQLCDAMVASGLMRETVRGRVYQRQLTKSEPLMPLSY